MLSSVINNIKNNSYQLFSFKLLIFLTILYIIDLSIGSVLNYYYFKQESGFQYRTTYSMEQTKADVLIFGSSRANHHYNPEIIESKLDLTCYNVGRDGNFIFYNYAVLMSIVHRYRPKVVILDLVKGEFRQNTESYERISSLLPYYDSHPEIRSIIELKGSYEKIKLLSYIYPYNSDMFSIAIGNTEYNKKKWLDINGFSPLSKKITSSVKIDTSFIDYKIDSVKIKYYENFINACKSKGIQLFIIVSPYYVISKDVDKSILIAQEIAENNNIRFLNYSQDDTFRLNNELFADISHLNSDGAELFTIKIVAEIETEKLIVNR